MGFSVFMSYSTKNLEVAGQVKSLLERTGSRVFLAQSSLAPGVELTQAILSAIERCDLFVLLWSSGARSSEWVPHEIGAARAHAKPVIPVILEAGMELPGFLKGLKYLPLYERPDEALAWLQHNVFERVQKKQQSDGLAWLGIGAAVLWLLSQGDGDRQA